jgi:hypothetical protein
VIAAGRSLDTVWALADGKRVSLPLPVGARYVGAQFASPRRAVVVFDAADAVGAARVDVDEALRRL